ncbi:soluble NSF attachment protein 29 [Ditylenchus destructor]|uniref:Soluble NSF attachment protein 29 n=1 Tax=Ditylenchus destructor TaxID=166010 RepID=A0AAD4QY21_9BILA|nr:soluble NSF attachment protein 29 [Ditylenchus destructor]
MANPFDDDNAYSNNRRGLGLDPVKSYSVGGSIEDEVADYEKEIEKYLQQSLDSTGRSRQQLEDSERLATSTAQDLLEQREKLEKADKNLDEIHSVAQMTQRSLNSLKSVFGGYFKNKFSRTPKQTSQEMPGSKSETQLSKVVDQVKSSVDQTSGSMSNQPTLGSASRNAIKGTRWEAMDDEIDHNLGEMSSQLARLRTLGTALGDEVEDQNKLLDRIQSKAERNDGVIRHQDNQMRNLLGYKN